LCSRLSQISISSANASGGSTIQSRRYISISLPFMCHWISTKASSALIASNSIKLWSLNDIYEAVMDGNYCRCFFTGEHPREMNSIISESRSLAAHTLITHTGWWLTCWLSIWVRLIPRIISRSYKFRDCLIDEIAICVNSLVFDALVELFETNDLI
jgi:hypothetical protein